MEKKIKRILGICLIISIFLLLPSKVLKATSTTAKIKGFNVNNMTYIDDYSIDDKKIYGSNYYYGNISMWASIYKAEIAEEDDNVAFYYFVFIESSIESRGKKKIGLLNNYFRNKYLTIDVYFNTKSDVKLIDCTSSSTNSQSSYSKSFGYASSTGAEIGTDNSSVNHSKTVSFSATNTQTFDSINLIERRTSDECFSKMEFEYYFTNWKDGKMISPNMGLVTERMYLVYQIQDYQKNVTNVDYEMNIVTRGTIFKDVPGAVNGTANASIYFDTNAEGKFIRY